MERYTYEITFTRLDGQPDEIQQHTSEELARECFRLFDEPDSAELRDLLRYDGARRMSRVVPAPEKGAQEAVLDYALAAEADGLSLVRVRLHTGRTHQIRVQFSSRALPLAGDVKYGSRYRDCALALWSHALGFRHPATGKAMSFSAMPESVFPWNGFEYFK